MMKRFIDRTTIMAGMLIMLTGIVWISGTPYTAIGKIYGLLKQEFLAVCHKSSGTDTEETLTMDHISTEYMDSFWQKRHFIDLNGWMAKRLRIQGYFSDEGIYITDSGYILSPAEKTSTDYEFEETMKFYTYLKQKGINLVYVNEPTKCLDDRIFSRLFGIDSFSNQNADLFLSRITKAGIPVLDLRHELVRDGMEIRNMFYRADHHWTTRSGLWATRKIAEKLNSCCGYTIDTSVYDERNYSFKEWSKSWLGEQGRKIGASYTGLDDYVEIKPKFNTSFTFKYRKKWKNGTFDQFIDESAYDTSADIYSTKSWHYSYDQPNVINHNVEKGKVLVLGDSYEQVVVPFLALGVSELDALILRNYDGDLKEYIEAGDYDTVLICYAQFMIGAHDDPESVNYKMFTFG